MERKNRLQVISGDDDIATRRRVSATRRLANLRRNRKNIMPMKIHVCNFPTFLRAVWDSLIIEGENAR